MKVSNLERYVSFFFQNQVFNKYQLSQFLVLETQQFAIFLRVRQISGSDFKDNLWRSSNPLHAMRWNIEINNTWDSLESILAIFPVKTCSGNSTNSAAVDEGAYIISMIPVHLLLESPLFWLIKYDESNTSLRCPAWSIFRMSDSGWMGGIYPFAINKTDMRAARESPVFNLGIKLLLLWLHCITLYIPFPYWWWHCSFTWRNILTK